ncbi:MAG: two-component regulator propeller domain-containing protein [Bacteroides sp.]|nr:two-component regulator propeller domain-containing protein [Bacteroides sp.]MDD4719276.1 two-component regulator propeller domain-containing protein [Bacteroides sp.]
MRKRTFIFGCFLFLLLSLCNSSNYRSFYNISLEIDATTVNCFAQDVQGMMWMGTNQGLYSYDGYSSKHHGGERQRVQIYCIHIVSDSLFYLGTDNGVLIYDYTRDVYVSDEVEFPRDVRTIEQKGNSLWIGSLNGLYTYDLNKQTLKRIGEKSANKLPNTTIYALKQVENKSLYIGTYNGLFIYNEFSDLFESIVLPSVDSNRNVFVNTLLEDSNTGSLWVGTEGELFRYSFNTKHVVSIPLFHGNSIKSLAFDSTGQLLIGTDNGLFIYNIQEEKIDHIVHDSRVSRSLTNNIIWSIFKDREDNIWLGTDYNISIAHNNKVYQSIPISQISGGGAGNRFYVLHRDSHLNYWLGGTNGVLFTPSLYDDEHSIWFKMGDSNHAISHNRIRHIYEDHSHNIWLATDGGIHCYSYENQQFKSYSIVDSTGVYNANWAYYLYEDQHNNFWIASFLGGILIVDKEKLKKSSGIYVAETFYNTTNGLSGNSVNHIIEDKLGVIWVLLYNKGINTINPTTGEIKVVQLTEQKDEQPNFIISDSDGIVWVAFKNELKRVDVTTSSIETIAIDTFGENEVLYMLEETDRIWLLTNQGVFIVNRTTYDVQRVSVLGQSFTAGYYDSVDNKVYLGASDEVIVVSPAVLNQSDWINPIRLTELYINNQRYCPVETNKQSIRYTNHLSLKSDDNNLIFEFSNLLYAPHGKRPFVFKLAGVDNDWKFIDSFSNKIIYNNLDYGSYELQIGELDGFGQVESNKLVFTFDIAAPWYYSIWAKIIYFLSGIGLLLWTINFFRVRNNLRLERLKKEKIQELSDMKMEFFANVSHEFKTPLSLIIAPISQLLLEAKDEKEKKQLQLIERHALKLSALTRQIIDFNRKEAETSGLMFSKIELVEFCRTLFAVYEDSYKSEPLEFKFTANQDSIFVEVDVLKLESVINNLLTNACRYTKSGSIGLNLYVENNKKVRIEVCDTGVGIPQKELPYVFERFYQSSKTKDEKEGTGIGLSLVKSYVEQHEGHVSIESQEGIGTCISIILPTKEDFEFETMIAQDNKDNLATILIVEDNQEISDFLYHLLNNKYHCSVAYNGKQGLKKAIETNPDLIIADVMMPIMDGLAMTQEIRKQIPLSTTPIILLTAKDDRQTKIDSLHLSVNAFLAKPFDPEILLSHVQQLLLNQEKIEKKIRLEVLSTPEAVEVVSSEELFLSEITELIEDRISDSQLNVSLLSELSGYGNKQLYRKTKQLTGLTPVEYIRSIRLKKAAMLLCKKKFTISEVMYMVGFSSPSYFARCFQQEFGETPSEFMEKY